MSKNIRVRFAPSPTGPLHMGGVRTALFNYLFAKKNNGTMILRIEDTDQTRFVPKAEAYIKESLAWTGIQFDEGVGEKGDFGPYKQSNRKEIYAKYIKELLANGKAYYAFDIPEELTAKREKYEAEGKKFMYGAGTRNEMVNSTTLSEDEVNSRIERGDKYVIRFKIPQDYEVKMTDIVRGDVTVNSNTLDDKVLMKSDGLPTYHFANIVDDHLMEISHVIRGEEWLPSLPLHYLLYEAFGWKKPEFAHLPLIMKPVGKGKLSKRDGAKMGFPVFPIEWHDEKTGEIYAGYKEDGYFPESFVNLLALLGWNPGTEQEIFTMDELIKIFDLSRVNKSGAKFDPEKAKWFQHQHLQRKSNTELTELLTPYLVENLGDDYSKNFDKNYIEKVIDLVKERATFVKNIWDQAAFFFVSPTEFNAKAVKKQWKETTPGLMKEVVAFIGTIEEFTAENIKEKLSEWITNKEIGFGKVMQPLRLSLVGALQGPDLFVILEMLGKNEVLNRLNYAIENIKR